MLSIVQYISENEDLVPVDPNQMSVEVSEEPNLFTAKGTDKDGDKILAQNFMKGKWNGPNPEPSIYDGIKNWAYHNFIDNSAQGSLVVDREDGNTYVKFNDGSKYKYDPNLNQAANFANDNNLFMKVQGNTKPNGVSDLNNVVDVGIGFGAGQLASKPAFAVGEKILHHPLNISQKLVTRQMANTPINGLIQGIHQ